MASENEQESEKRETVSDIVAEMRYGIIRKHRTDHELLALYSDRIEAAWKREREELDKRISDLEAYAKLWTDRADELRLKCDEFYAKAKPVGNAAAMREALETIHDKVNGLDEECGVDPVEIRDLARAALSAPARNCDRFASIEEARSAYCSECGRIISIWDGDESWLFERWLLAPAAEQKGEGDGCD